MSHIKGSCNRRNGPRWTPRRASGSSDDVQAGREVAHALKASWRSLWCWLLDHRWDFALVRGDDGEPGGDMCSRCRAERPNYSYPCRCLGGCKCESEGFVGVE